MRKGSRYKSLLIGVAVGFAVAAVMTGLDWRLNPGGVFRGESGTHWRPVGETFVSWFWPVWLAASGVALAVAWLRDRR